MNTFSQADAEAIRTALVRAAATIRATIERAMANDRVDILPDLQAMLSTANVVRELSELHVAGRTLYDLAKDKPEIVCPGIELSP